MLRPKLTERLTIRLPEELLQDLSAAAARRGCSLNEVALCSFENDLSRMATYRVDYYDLRRVLPMGQGDNDAEDYPAGGQPEKLSDMMKNCTPLTDSGSSKVPVRRVGGRGWAA